MYVDNSWLSLDPIYLSLLHATRISDNFRGHGWTSRWRIHLSAGCFAIPSYWSTMVYLSKYSTDLRVILGHSVIVFTNQNLFSICGVSKKFLKGASTRPWIVRVVIIIFLWSLRRKKMGVGQFPPPLNFFSFLKKWSTFPETRKKATNIFWRGTNFVSAP